MSVPPDYEPTLFEGDEAVARKAAKKKVSAKKAAKKATAKKTSAKKASAKKAAAKKKAAPKKKAAAKKKVAAVGGEKVSKPKKAKAKATGSDDALAVISNEIKELINEADPDAAVVKRPRRGRGGSSNRGFGPSDDAETVAVSQIAQENAPVQDESQSAESQSEQRQQHRPSQDHQDGQEQQRSGRDRRGRNRRGRDRHRDKDRNQNRSKDRETRENRENRPRKEVELGPPMEGSGFVELSPKGFGFLRQADRNFYQTNKDTFIPPDMVRDFGLRDGLIIKGEVRRGPRGPQLTAIHTINDKLPAVYGNLPVFEEFTAINPNKRWILETDASRHTTRIIDMIAPVGRGQRGLIVAPPRTGKTTLLEHIAQGMIKNYPDAKVIILLIDERPEEVTELTRALPEAEIMASSNDNDTRTHMRVAELTIERAKRLVEAGEDVFILLDSITRLARSYNRANKGKGGLNKGGLSNRALEVPRRLFAAARNTREAGSLTILATALIDTGTMMDEAIFQEFKGTGNMELVLDKKISQNYIYPAVDIFKSGTRREELLLPPHQIEKIYVIRRGLSGHKPIEAIERLLSFVERFPNNAQMLLEIKASASA